MTKTFSIRGHVEGTITAADPDFAWFQFAFVDIGITTHAGRHYNVGTTRISTADGTGSGAGVWTAACGDTLDWEVVSSPGEMSVTVISGTGRYEGAVGGFTAEVRNLVVDPVAGTVTYDYAGTGELTY